MFKNTQWISHITRRAIDGYLSSVDMSKGTVLNPLHDLSTLPFSAHLPLIPDVAVQYRCGDNMQYGNIGYGVFPFRAFKQYIPTGAKFILVMSDPPHRMGNHPSVIHCHGILGWLFDYLKKEFPQATVVVKRGGDIYLDFARLALADVTICSASTFCLFPSMAHNGSAVYYPLTKLIGVPPKPHEMNDHFHWVKDPPLLTDVLKPWYLIEYALNGRPILPEMIEGHLLKGKGRQIFFIKNHTRYAFPNGDTFEGLGFDWGDVWQLGDSDVNQFPTGGDIPGCDKETCLSSPFYQNRTLKN